MRWAGRQAVAVLGSALLAGCRSPEAARAAASEKTQQLADAAPSVERGKYLVTVLACNDCHTPLTMGPQGPAPDMSRMLSGHPEQLLMPAPPKPEGPWLWVGAATNTAYGGPWGISYASNLTPDEATGMGSWTEEIFVSTIRTGKHWGQSRPILPPMPWQSYSRMTDDDLKAIFAYLRSIPPIRNRVPDVAPLGTEPSEKL